MAKKKTAKQTDKLSQTARFDKLQQTRRQRNRDQLQLVLLWLTHGHKVHWALKPIEDLLCVSVHGYLWVDNQRMIRLHLNDHGISATVLEGDLRLGEESFGFRAYKESLFVPNTNRPTPLQTVMKEYPSELNPLIKDLDALLKYWSS